MEKPFMGQGTNWKLNACLNSGLDGWYVYGVGYRRAAEILTGYVRENVRDQDGLIFPVIFLWRHHLELKLKSICRAASTLLGREWRPTKEHDLSQLFAAADKLLIQVFAEFGERAPTAELAAVRDAMAGMKKIDAASMTFRYPEDLSQRNHLEGVRHINYDEVAAFFAPIADILDSVELALSIFEDWRQDWLSAQL